MFNKILEKFYKPFLYKDIMKICFLSTSFPRFKDDWVLPSLDVEARELSKCKGNDVIVISSAGTDTKKFELRGKIKIYRFSYFIKKYQTLTYTGGLSTSFKEGIMSKLKSIPFMCSFMLNTLKYGRKCDIKHCYDYDKFDKKDDTSSFKKEFNLKNEKIVTFLGRMDNFKDPITFVKSIPYVLKKIKDIKFFIVGYGFLLEDVKKLVKKLKLEKSVIITGPRKDVNIILESSDIFVNLSPDENYFSVAIQESMAKKTPCLLTNAGQTEKTFTHKENVYLVNPKSPEETADAIIKLLTNKKLCKKLGENGIKLLKKHRYTKDDIINELNSLYKKLVN